MESHCGQTRFKEAQPYDQDGRMGSKPRLSEKGLWGILVLVYEHALLRLCPQQDQSQSARQGRPEPALVHRIARPDAEEEVPHPVAVQPSLGAMKRKQHPHATNGSSGVLPSVPHKTSNRWGAHICVENLASGMGFQRIRLPSAGVAFCSSWLAIGTTARRQCRRVRGHT